MKKKKKESGPITVSEYMAQCLGHPEFGYYNGDHGIFGGKKKIKKKKWNDFSVGKINRRGRGMSDGDAKVKSCTLFFQKKKYISLYI